MATYLPRAAARAYLKEVHGVELGQTGLENMASDDLGPRYTLIAGRALYTHEWLDQWVAAEAARPVSRRRRKSRATTGGAAGRAGARP